MSTRDKKRESKKSTKQAKKKKESSNTSMASSTGSGGGATKPKYRLGFWANAMKRKDSYIQFIAMTAVLMVSMKSVSQKYRAHSLEEETYTLREENLSLTNRLNNIKQSLLHEASLDSTGIFASRLRHLFGEEP
ncbi:unnamed protein product [Lupinus luteus]|uniref:Uncharacterized protein n=1 Tax=Lupinus luteus TaxID=3873 RepID=A0AAV1W9R4_LUPLU